MANYLIWLSKLSKSTRPMMCYLLVGLKFLRMRIQFRLPYAIVGTFIGNPSFGSSMSTIFHDGKSLDESSTAPNKNKNQSSVIKAAIAIPQSKDSVPFSVTQAIFAAQEVEVSNPRLASFRDKLGNEVIHKTKLVALNIPKKGSPEWQVVVSTNDILADHVQSLRWKIHENPKTANWSSILTLTLR